MPSNVDFGTRVWVREAIVIAKKVYYILRNVSPSLVLCDHFPGGGILELQTGSSWEWPFIVCLFWE